MEEDKSLKDEIRELREELRDKGNKPLKIPRRARLSNNKVKKGYITAAVIRDNKNVDFVTTEMIDGTYKIDKDTYHVSDEDSVYFYKGKPFVFQPKKSLNPVNMLYRNNETYGQKVVMARMINDTIKPKKPLPMGWIIGLVVVGVILYLILKK